MMSKSKSVNLICLIIFLCCAFAFGQNDYMAVSKLPEIEGSVGLAGPFAGVSDGKLLLAGGANFPDGRPWDGAAKKWHDEIYVLDSFDGKWNKIEKNLPHKAAYGVSLPWQDSVICVGGSDGVKCHRDVFSMSIVDGEVVFQELPSLPVPLAFMCGEILDGVLYVAGGISANDASETSRHFYSLDLKLPAEDLEWQEFESWPGVGRMLSTSAVQGGAFYLFGGTDLYKDETGETKRKYLNDAYKYKPGEGWNKIADMPVPLVAAPTPAMPIGPSHIQIFGGDDGSFYGKDLRDDHPGFPAKTYVYHTITDTWVLSQKMAELADMGLKPSVTANSVVWDGRYVVPSGEIRPGVRTNSGYVVETLEHKGAFNTADYIVIIVYLIFLVWIGYYFSKREKGTDDFFKGGQRVPWWAAGLSVFATMLSAITFMAIPAKTYSSNWIYLLANLSVLLLAPFVIKYYLPFYRKLNISSAYEYLEKRFNFSTRAFGSITFLLFQVGRMAVVLFLPAIALATVSPIDVYTCIIIMGVLCIAYTMMGGIEAVIWTDALQAIVLIFGAIVTLIVISIDFGGDFGQMFAIANESDKFHMVDWTWDMTTTSVFVVVFGNILSNLAPYTSDQAVVQRYITTPNQKDAAKAIWTNALISFPASVLFFSVGTALFVFYKKNSAELVPTLATDAIYPLFIVKNLPVGIAGLVIAGLFAAAQSTLSSSLNSMATVSVEDFYKRFKPNSDDHKRLLVARCLTLAFGVIGVSAALMMASLDIKSLWDQFFKILGLCTGGLSGLFALGIFTKRANGLGALVGAILSAIIVLVVQKATNLHFFLYGGTGLISCFVIGYFASLILPAKSKDLTNLTIYTQNTEEQDECSVERN